MLEYKLWYPGAADQWEKKVANSFHALCVVAGVRAGVVYHRPAPTVQMPGKQHPAQ